MLPVPAGGDVRGCVRGCWVLTGSRRTLVAVEAPPALLAVALPRLLAGAMQAAGVAGALVAALALPALVAHTLAG